MTVLDDQTEDPIVYVEGLSPIERVEALQTLLVERARGGEPDAGIYRALRNALRSEPWWTALPGFVRSCRTPSEFWSFIKPKFPSYAERTEFICDELRPVFNRLEGVPASVPTLSDTLASMDAHEAHLLWQKALARVDADPEGAITAARSLLESTCKVILDDLDDEEFTYSDGDDLTKLFRTTAKALNLAPHQHSEQVFRQILSGVRAVVEGIGSVRNSLGDAHGRGRSPVRPTPRHARLVANLAGSAAEFLIETAGIRLPREPDRP